MRWTRSILRRARRTRRSATSPPARETRGSWWWRLTAGSWTHLTDLFTTPGFSDERISLYLARDLSYGESHPDEDEFLNVVRVPLAYGLVALSKTPELPQGNCAMMYISLLTTWIIGATLTFLIYRTGRWKKKAALV